LHPSVALTDRCRLIDAFLTDFFEKFARFSVLLTG
jgi:hypothetical protein